HRQARTVASPAGRGLVAPHHRRASTGVPHRRGRHRGPPGPLSLPMTFDWYESDTLTALPLTHTHGEAGQFVLGNWAGVGLRPACTKHGAMLRVSREQDWWRCMSCNIGCDWDRSRVEREIVEGFQAIIADLAADGDDGPG